MSHQADNQTSRFSCYVDGCKSTFTRVSDAERHVKEKHGPLKRCTVDGCPWTGAKREGRVMGHMKRDHPELLSVYLNVPDEDTWMEMPWADQDPGQNQENSLQTYEATSTYGPNYAAQNMAQPTYATGPPSTSFTNQAGADQNNTAQYGGYQLDEQSSALGPTTEDQDQYSGGGEEGGNGGYSQL